MTIKPAEFIPVSESNVTDVRLCSLRLRELTPFDRCLQSAYFDKLSFDSRRARFMLSMYTIPESLLDVLSSIDGKRHFAVLVESRIDGVNQMVAEARYAVDEDQPNKCEFAISVDDAWHGYGLGTSLLTNLQRKAYSMGMKKMVGETLYENKSMVNLARRCGFKIDRNNRDTSALILSKFLSPSLITSDGLMSSSLQMAA
jgi:RimJ/RimL family protein N-acetyltransferase